MSVSSTSSPVIQEQLVIGGTSREMMYHVKSARGQLSRKTYGQALLYIQLVNRSYGSIYTRVLLKTTDEVVVEGMCNGVSKHADYIRGLSYGRYDIILKP